MSDKIRTLLQDSIAFLKGDIAGSAQRDAIIREAEAALEEQQTPLELTDTEAKALVKLHTQLLYHWADKSPPGPITQETQDQLLASVVRLFDCIENHELLPGKERKQ